MKFLRTTNYWQNYWRERKADWKKDYQSPEMINHPHRKLIIQALKSFPWISLVEIGCGAGANLVNIVKYLSGRQVGGIDINADAIKLCEQTFNGGYFRVGPGEDILMSDNSVDVVLSDMALIYVSPKKIDKYLNEIWRIGRNNIVFCEFHSKSFWQRLKLRWRSGYFAHNWQKLLEKKGFYDVWMYKLTEADWPGGNPQKDFAWLIVAKIPKK